MPADFRGGAQPPAEGEAPRVSPPEAVAGGLPAIASTVREAARHMGLVRGARTLLRTNQMDGFDCPGCAWPEPDLHRSVVEFCENGAKAVASEATLRRADPEFFAAHSIDDLASRADVWLNDAGRLTHPMVKREGGDHYEPISWDDALGLVAAELRALATPDAAAFYTSGRTSNEAAFLYQLFARQLGTNNLPDCSNMCHESSGRGLSEVLGVGKGTVSLDDFEKADAIFVIGQNPGTNHPRMLTTLQAAAKRGATIVSVNPLPEAGTMRFQHPQDVFGMLGAGTELARLHLPVKVNGDVAVLKGIMKEMLARQDGVDRAFVDEHTDGFEAFRAALDATRWEDVLEASGVSREKIAEAARIACEAKALVACWAMGITQHRNGVANVQEIANFLLLKGNVGRPGAGACPVRGHSNVQGDRTMGISERMGDDFLDRLGAAFSFEPPRRHGHDTVQTIGAMERGDVKVFFAMGGNFLSAAPDTERTARALERCRLTAHVSTKLNRGHLVTGGVALILPCLGRTEADAQASGPQFVTVENSMSVVSASRGTLPPASPELRSEVAIVCGLARATLGAGARSTVDWEALAADYDAIRDQIARVVPGFEGFNARVREPGGFHLPNAARERVFETATKKARFTVHPIPRHALLPGQLLMMTMRSHDQYNTTVYGLDDRYRGVHGGRRVVFLSPEDARERGLSHGDRVDLTSHFEDGERHARGFSVVVFHIPRGSAATYFPEANVLVPLGSVAEKSNTPASKSVVISVSRAG
jgi:molybdopterin-dependent oxidoreductase alpha subunit